MGTQQFQLKWNNHQSNMVTVFDQLLSSEALVDVTLACEGLSLKAHKIVLSACSPFFQNLFLENPCTHPIVIMKDMKYAELKAIVDFIYKGEVNVSHYQLNGLLKTAELLNIKGLIEVADENINYEPEQPLQNEVTEQQSVDTSQTIPFSSAEQKKVASPSLHKKRRGKRKRRISNDSTSTENEEIPPKLQESRINDKILSETISDSHNEVSVSQQEQFQVSSDHPNSSVSQNLFFPSTQEDTFVNVEEPPEDEQNYSESPDFVKQIILTESKSLLQDCASQGPTICSVSSQGTVQAEFRNSNFINTGSQDSEKLVSCSTLSETSTPNFLDDEMPVTFASC
ncbi:longitudinals lacking protein, isoforms H/M/V-like isoform X2 [Centruroides sculpturatus]|uniref:longitudinals lacking protein, isoforms H/M/V-like isoform X2 n=1 Tax=Centruroides sculpturatus TaxID=218467 RepID=UPI000C6CD2E8|nr:longitudinals lacking protein, isoforms H/M/V-like isoform X2 [Centruroides sculpturatus]